MYALCPLIIKNVITVVKSLIFESKIKKNNYSVELENELFEKQFLEQRIFFHVKNFTFPLHRNEDHSQPLMFSDCENILEGLDNLKDFEKTLFLCL